MKDRMIHIGTSGWSYKHWSGIFYPEEINPGKYLEFYIGEFSSVELNSSFYNLPLKTTVNGWLRRTPSDFRFCPKMSRFITHQLQLLNTGEALNKYFEAMEAMKSKLGPILIQLPPGLQYDRSIAADFFGLINERFDTYQFAVEVRNRSWMNDSFHDLLSGYGMGSAIADSGDRYPYNESVTSQFVYLRFHGREHLYASDYNEADLDYYASKIASWQSEGKEIWAFFNNDFNGYAIKNARQLRELIERRLIFNLKDR